MSKRIIVLALAAASVAAFAVPTTAMAEDVPLHMVPAPLGEKTIDGDGGATLTSVTGYSVKCTASSGRTEFTSSTTGTFEQTFHGCIDPFGGKCTTAGQAEGTITTLNLDFHLLTVEDTVTHATGPGVLVTPNAGFVAFFRCAFIGEVAITGNGLIGTITKPQCGESSFEPTIDFSSSSTGVQTHRTVVGTSSLYTIWGPSGEAASEDWSGTITLGEQANLECT